MKKNRIWLFLAGLCLVLGTVIMLINTYAINDLQIVQETGIESDGRNKALAYDEENHIIYLSTQEGVLAAYQGEEKIWVAPEAVGAYNKLVINKEKDKLYTGTDGGHVYIYDSSDGSVILDINVQRMVVGLAINKDESKIAVVTNTGKNKSNLIVYSTDGELLYNTSYSSTTLRQVEYCADGETLLIGNKKGRIVHSTEDGETLDVYEANYDIQHMKVVNGMYYVLSADGTYHVMDGVGVLVRKGKVENVINAVLTTLGTDASGEYIFLGSKEGYIFVMNGQDQEIYRQKHDFTPMDTAAAEDKIYYIGIGNKVYILSITDVVLGDNIKIMNTVLTVAAYLLWIAAVVCLCIGVIKIRNYLVRLFRTMWKQRIAYLFLSPIFLLLFFFTYRPIFTGLTRAFTNWSKVNNTLAELEFVGLDNFVAIFKEGYFLLGIKNLVILLGTNLLKTLTVPLLIAWLIYSIKGNRRKYIHRFLFVLPMVVPGIVSTMIWQRIYDPNGLINSFLRLIGKGEWAQIWLSNPKTAIWAIVMGGFPFVSALPMLIYYGALGNIGEEVIESALIDGANKWHIFWKVQLPLIKPQLGLMIFLTFVGGVQDYSGIYIMTGGGPGTATYVPALELFLNVSDFGRYGYASAMGIVIMLFTLSATLISNRMKRKGD